MDESLTRFSFVVIKWLISTYIHIYITHGVSLINDLLSCDNNNDNELWLEALTFPLQTQRGEESLNRKWKLKRQQKNSLSGVSEGTIEESWWSKVLRLSPVSPRPLPRRCQALPHCLKEPHYMVNIDSGSLTGGLEVLLLKWAIIRVFLSLNLLLLLYIWQISVSQSVTITLTHLALIEMHQLPLHHLSFRKCLGNFRLHLSCLTWIHA